MAATLRHLPDIPVYHPNGRLIGSMLSLLHDPLTFHLEPYRSLGSVYRMRALWQTLLVLVGPEANEFIWRNGELWRYSQTMRIFREEFDATFLLQLDGEPHRRKYRRMAQGFKPATLTPQLPVMYRVLSDAVAAVRNAVVDVRELCRQLTVSMTCQALLRVNLPPDVGSDVLALEKELLVGATAWPLRLHRLWYLRPAYLRLKRRLFAQITQMLDQRAAYAHGDDDILSLILKAHPSDQPPLTRQEISYDVFLLLEASLETTAHLLLWALMYIYDQPEWLAALRDELEHWDAAALTQLNDKPRLMATIYEIERLRPPVPFFTLISAQPFEYQGVQVPEGTLIMHPAALPHFLPELYDEPLCFKPQRFLGQLACPHKAHSTYGGGKHTCLGKPLARNLLQLSIAHIVCNYDLVFIDRPSFQLKLGTVITPAEPALPVRFVPR